MDDLFAQRELRTELENRKRQMQEKIDAQDENRLLNSSNDDLCDYFEAEYRVEPLVIDESRITQDSREAKIDVSNNPHYSFARMARDIRGVDRTRPIMANGSIREIFIPFEGEADLFKYQASTTIFHYPRGRVDNNTNCLVMTFETTTDRYDGIAQEIKSDIERLKKHIEFSNADVDKFNSAIREQALTQIEARRTRILKRRNVDASLPFPMRSRADGTPTYAAPEVRRKIVPKLPDVSESLFAQEPILTDADYDNVLSVISSMSLTMERAPSAFESLNEEALRSHYLALLNGHYDGQATGETFNHTGKTDILIRSGNKNVFVAECKFWTGPKSFNEAINQLLGYTCWRDTKAALIVFNRDTQMSTVLEKIPSIVENHPNYKRTVPNAASETSFRYHFGHRDDMARELVLSVLVFDVPNPTESTSAES